MDSGRAATDLRDCPTDWVLIQLAHANISAESRAIWNELVMRYEEPVRRLLRQLVRNPDVAEDLYQEFWHRFLRGDFAGARAERGRFRNLLRTSISNLVIDYFRRTRRWTELNGHDIADPEPTLLERLSDQHILFWRNELIERTRRNLNEECTATGERHALVLETEIEHTQQSSAEKGRLLGARFGSTVSPENYRQLLRRARLRFVTLLVEEVQRSLTDPTPDLIREELAELRLLEFCGFELD